MQINLLPQEERIALGATHRAIITHADLTVATANTAQVINITALKLGSYIRNVYTKVQTAFKNSADAAFNTTAITVGDTGTANLYVSSQETNANGAVAKFKAGTGTQKAYLAADDLTITFNSMAGKALSSLDTGELHVFFSVTELNEYETPVN